MKKKRCMAEGGIVETPEQTLVRMNAKYRLGGTGTSPAPQPKEKPRVEQQPAQPQRPAPIPREGIADVIGRRNEELKKAAGYARGGIMPVVGAGTGTSDSIPVVVAGQDIRLSNGEGAAILPAETMKNKAAVRAVEEIIEATNGKPIARNDDEEREGMACGGIVGKRKMAGGGVIDPEEEKRQQAAPTAQEVYAPVYRAVSDAANSVTTPTAQTAPTAQEVYRNVSASGMADAVTPQVGLSDHPIYSGVSASGAIDALRNWGSTATPAAEPASAVAPAVPLATAAAREPVPATTPTAGPSGGILAALPEGGMLRPENRQRMAAINENGMVGPIFGSAPAASAQTIASGSQQTATQQASPSRTAPTSAEADRTISEAQAPNPSLAANTGNSGATTTPGGAQQVNMGAGFDPTKLKMADGYGMITDPKTGRTMMVSGAGAQPVAGGSVDAYGNSTVATDQLKAQLAATQAQGGAADSGPKVSMLQSLPIEQAGRDHFTQFVRQSDADRLAHDLGTGGGNVRTNAGKIAALDAMRKGIADDLGRKTQVEVAGIQGANQLATEDARGRNQLANTGLVGQNQLAVEDLRQSGPEKVLRAAKLQSEVEDASAKREARNNLLSAIKSGDPNKASEAWRMGIAAGIVKPENPEKMHTPYRFHTDPMGNAVRINEATGATDVLDRATGTYKPVNAIEPAPREPANRKAGQTYQTPNGPMIWRGTGWEPAQAR